MTPVTTPDNGSTVATVVSLLLHTPPGVVSDNIIVARAQTFDGPDIGVFEGNGLTVSVVVIRVVSHDTPQRYCSN